jgi:hypothetical protein
MLHRELNADDAPLAHTGRSGAVAMGEACRPRMYA